MAQVDNISVLATAPANSSMPDSITLAGGDIWVAYTNGADSTGLSGQSTIVEYDQSGKPLHTPYQIAGSVDGLKVDPVTGRIWALQNQDGNSTLTIIDPETGSVSDPISYKVPSSSQGYDDVVFRDGKVFLSYTNPPGTSGDPTVVELLNGKGNGLGMGSQRSLVTKTVLTDGTVGINTVTGAKEVFNQTDPDSLKLAPNGDLLLTSGNDGIIIDISKPGTPHQTVFFTQVPGVTPGQAGLDDVIMPNATSGTFYISDTAQNEVLAVHVTGLNEQDYYASVGSLGAFGQMDPKTGVFTPLVSAANFPGFGSPHGVEFVADKNAQNSQVNVMTATDVHIVGSSAHNELHAGLHFG